MTKLPLSSKGGKGGRRDAELFVTSAINEKKVLARYKQPKPIILESLSITENFTLLPM